MSQLIDARNYLAVRTREDIDAYCAEHGITRKDFNQPVVLLEGITDCDKYYSSE